MEHATALVDHDATTRAVSAHGTPLCTHCGFVCGCQRLVDAGWSVRCNACGRGTGAAEVAGADLLTLVYRPGQHTCGVVNCEACMDELDADDVEADDRIRHRGDRIRSTIGAGWSLEDYDVERDADLVAAAELSHPVVTLDMAS